MANASGPRMIMVIRHAEKPGTYNGTSYNGVDATASTCGSGGGGDLTTIGWQRAGGLVTLFAPPYGPKANLGIPAFLYAADPQKRQKSGASSSKSKAPKESSHRPYETISPLAAALSKPSAPMTINTSFSRDDYPDMVADALTRSGVVLICWQHEDIALLSDDGQPGISQCILTQTGTTTKFPVPESWPKGRYDLVSVFDRPAGTGAITGFQVVPQFLLAGDGPYTAAG